MCAEVVDWDLDLLTFFDFFDDIFEEIPIKGTWMVKVVLVLICKYSFPFVQRFIKVVC